MVVGASLRYAPTTITVILVAVGTVMFMKNFASPISVVLSLIAAVIMIVAELENLMRSLMAVASVGGPIVVVANSAAVVVVSAHPEKSIE
jgi:hypothetical protein